MPLHDGFAADIAADYAERRYALTPPLPPPSASSCRQREAAADTILRFFAD
jgi:hypothetical protein